MLSREIETRNAMLSPALTHPHVIMTIYLVNADSFVIQTVPLKILAM